MSTTSGQCSERYEGPFCGQPVPNREQLLHEAAEQWALDRIRKEHPEWVQDDGICPKCLEYFRQLAED